MLFRQIVFYALLMGVIAGGMVTVAQTAQVVPIILAAETFEGAESSALVPFKAEQSHSHAAAVDDGGDEWAPADGLERTMFTLLANVLTAMGFALLLLTAMVASSRLLGNRFEKVDWRYGLAWGAAGYAVFWLAPALGLPPEIPLATAAPLEDRQWWWVLAAVFTATGLAGLAFLRSPLRWAMPFLLLVPHIIGAPHVDSALFADQPPEVAVQLESLAQQFIGASALVNALLWLVIGLVGVWALRRIVGANETGRDRMSSAA